MIENSEEPIYGHMKSVKATTIIDDSEEEWDAVEDDNNDHGAKTIQKKNPWTTSQDSFSKTFSTTLETSQMKRLYGKLLVRESK